MARYPFPWDLFFQLVLGFPHPKRSLVNDARLMHARIEPRPRVLGEENIPADGPCLIAANHYQRRGLWIGWPGAVISSLVGGRRGEDPPVFWLVTGGIRLLQQRNRGPVVPGSGSVLRAIGQTYGMSALGLKDGMRRAAALNAWLSHIDRKEVLGAFPEGLSGKASGLSDPGAGFNRLCALVCARSCPILPTGIYEEEDVLHISFGELLPPKDCIEAELVMRCIARQLPPRQRGRYAGEFSQGALT